MRYGIVLLICLQIGVAQAQWKNQLPPMQIKKAQGGTICYHKPEDSNLIIPPPAAYEAWKRNPSAKTSATTFEVTYVNFSTEAQLAFQKAVDIWSGLIESPVPIRILAVWQPISGSALGGAAPGTYIRDFDGAPKVLTWYPVALAEKITGTEFNAADAPDIFAQFNSSFTDWSFRTDGVAVSGKTDLVSVVLHEIGHGLGITKAYDVNPTQGIVSDFLSGLHVPYDHFIENNAGLNLVQNFDPPSAPLRVELTSGALFFRSPLLPKNSVDNRARIYAPATFASGSSIAHLDESTYNNTSNALMTPFIGNAEVMHNPGTLVMRMLADMGWVNTRIVHTALPNTENVSSSYPVVVTLQADTKNQDGGVYSYNANEVKLNYTTNGTTFTVVSMNPTGQPNQFSASIPNGFAAYGYFISVKDNLDRTLVKPGIYTDDGAAPVQRFFSFEAGPDTKAPEISHTPKGFLLATDTELTLEANITDNIGILNALLEYQVNTGSLATAPLTLISGNTYKVTIPLPALSQGDLLKYRIKVTDNSVAQNIGALPSASTFFEVNVVGLAPTQDSYANDFNNTVTASQDFFGSPEFSVRTETGFTDGAIHTNHPYPEGQGFPNNRYEWVYQLRVPVRVKAVDATIKFDEVVLIEPGETGAAFPSEDFYDYVVVDGSKDGGVTWTTVANGYDSRDFAPWLTRYNSASSGNNSTAVGDATLFRSRTLNLQDKFDTNDEVVIRFRLFSDPGAAGWGWAIDNLKIQIDETPPTILHTHFDFVLATAPNIPLVIQPSDASGLNQLFVDVKVNGSSVQTDEIEIKENVVQYQSFISVLGGFEVGDKVEYRIRASDLAGNETILPVSGFFQVPVINFGTPVTQYITDFNTTNTDFVGNFLSITQPSGFLNNGVHTPHPYPNGFGLTNSTSSYTLTLLKPITVSATNPYIQFSEIALVEYSGTANKDFVVVEGSSDEGETWQQLVEPYSARSLTAWKNIFDVGGSGTANAYRNRLIDITSSGDFEAGDNVLIRFRISADGTGNGWGWSMDNLSIQGPVTGVKEFADLLLSVYPNPTHGDSFTLEVKGLPAQISKVQITNLQGQRLISDELSISGSTVRKEFSTAGWANGVYIVRLNLEDGSTIIKKLLKQNQQ
ncbi:MAG: zinc-dependent metalloprotease [Cyclobacteriaceae bacterium]|nr:zinc-dependent metalloprotease [Cyclobacteriaceae bacterium]